MAEDKYVIHLVGQNLEDPSKEEAYYKWYHESHIYDNFNDEGCIKAFRYKRIGDDANLPTYLTIYTFKDAAAFADYERKRAERMKAAPPRPADAPNPLADLGIKPAMRVQYQLIRTWEK